MRFLHDLLLGNAARQPDQPAIVSSAKRWTYAELDVRARAYARELAQLGLGPEDRVCCVLDNSHEAIALLAAFSLRGITFSVLAPEAPLKRRQTVMEEVGVRCLFVQDAAAVPAGAGVPVAYFEGEGLGFDHPPLEAPPRLGAPKLIDLNIAYILYTSGSTGKPKGIALSHLGAVTFLVELINDYGLKPGDRYSTVSPLQFDFALMDMCLALGSGATLVLVNRANLRKPVLLVDELAAMRVTHFAGVPTLWKLILRFASDQLPRLSELRSIIFGGEHFPREHINTLYSLLPKVRLFNVYGQAESIACTWYELPRPLPDTPHLPVGRGHRDVEMILLDDAGRRVTTPETPAELYLRGKLLFSGYFNNPEETKQRLVVNPLKPQYNETLFRTGDICYFDADGMFYFIGRLDNQVKVNGHRVELEEIEAVLSRHPVVGDICVVAKEYEQRMWLHAFVIRRSASDQPDAVVVESLRQHSMEHLPSYMCPQHFHFVERIPISTNGKSDRKSLAQTLDVSAAPRPRS